MRPFRYVLVPVYLVAGLFCLTVGFGLGLLHNRDHTLGSLLRGIAFVVCCAVCLIPAPLIEFRYFIMPYLLWRLELEWTRSSWGKSNERISELALAVVVNVVSVCLFLFFPFTWFSEPFVWQRYMW